jgi:hypothetical protein
MITQKKYLNLIALLVALITGVLFLPGLSHADVAVIKEYDFGKVVVGTSKLATLNISTDSIDEVLLIRLTLINNYCALSINSEVPLPKPLPEDIDINYAPSEEGPCTSTLDIATTSGSATVTLTGTGIITQEITINGILGFFDSCVAADVPSLEGYVPNKSDKKRSADKITDGNGSDKLAENRLNALRNMIETAGDLIDSEKNDEACGQLEAVYKKMDGLNTPGDSIDFVEGSAVVVLADMVQDLMGKLECK